MPAREPSTEGSLLLKKEIAMFAQAAIVFIILFLFVAAMYKLFFKEWFFGKEVDEDKELETLREELYVRKRELEAMKDIKDVTEELAAIELQLEGLDKDIDDIE